MSPTQETCFQGLTTSVGDGENCMYDGGPSSVATATPYGEVTGPYNHIAYYDSVATPAAFQTTVVGLGRVVYAPSVGDGKIQQVITGTVTIDDGGNGFGADDLIGFNITLRSSGTGSIVRVYSGSAGVDKYDSMTQVLAPTVANSATPNGSGGFDYVIGTEGFPSVLTYAEAGDCLGAEFGFAECGHIFSTPPVDPDFWNGTSAAGLGSLESNFGARTTGTVVNLQCIDGSSTTSGVESNDCRDSQVLYSPWVLGPCAVQGGCTLKEGDVGAVRGSAEDVGWDQLLLKVSTDAAGNVVGVAGFNVDDYRTFNNTRCGDNTVGTGSYSATCNSWTSGYFTLTTTALGPNDDTADAESGQQVSIAVLANDTGLTDPVTVTVTVAPNQGGTATPAGSPGAAAGITINYTSAPGFTGEETFTYRAVGGSIDDTAVVTVTVEDTVPTAITFTSQTGVALSTPITSATATIGGISTAVPISVSAGSEYAIDGGVFTAAAGFVQNNQDVQVRHTSAATPATDTVTTLTVGGFSTVQGTFTSTTLQYAIDDAVTTGMNQPVEIDVLQNDVGLLPTVFVGIWIDPLHGTASVSPVPASPSVIRITYTPNPGYFGPDSFEYWVESGLVVDYAVVNVTVTNPDTDGDGVLNTVDNCTLLPNPSQCDSDGDGYGNRCDGDFTGNGATNAQDTVVFRQQLGKPSVGPTYNGADLNCNGAVNAQDTALFRQLLGKPPGPSGLVP